MSLRNFVLVLGVCFSIVASCLAALPLTVKEISLMLRSGYSSAAVLKDLSVRHFADTFTGIEEHLLQQAGASPELLNALRQGSYSLSAEQTAAAQQKMADVTKRETTEGERLRSNTLSRDQVAQSQKGGVVKLTTPAGPNVIHDLVKDQLVAWQNGSVSRFDDSKLENKKLIGLYFSAHWCGPCRKFTPELVDYYNRTAPQHPEFEVIFVSDDKSAAGMETYMRETNMPWPAIDFQKVSAATEIKKYAGRGIPCLVLIDSTGKVVSNSYDGSNYVGPKKVLTDLDAIFAKGTLAQAR
jgi:nucleoredoxin